MFRARPGMHGGGRAPKAAEIVEGVGVVWCAEVQPGARLCVAANAVWVHARRG